MGSGAPECTLPSQTGYSGDSAARSSSQPSRPARRIGYRPADVAIRGRAEEIAMAGRSILGVLLMATGLIHVATDSGSAHAQVEEAKAVSVRYLEIVTDDVEGLVALYSGMHGLTFGPPVAEMGQARVATRADGTQVGIRKPLAAHETPIVRTYVAVDDIQRAVKAAEEAGAMVAYPPTKQGAWGTFSIVIHGGVQHGLWQR